MNSASRDKKYISFFYLMLLQNFFYRSVFYSFFVFFSIDFFGETGNQLSSLLGLNYIPHFCFAERIMSLFCKLVIRMYLNGQIIPCIYKLDQQRKLHSILLK